MKLENSFTVPVPREQAWDVLMDVERIAPCMPGATLTSRDGDSFTGTVKVKVGPINLTYGGQASFVSLDKENGVAVIEGSGKETRGTGTAKATITCRLVETDGTTRVDVDTDLAVTGKPAQFGRGVLADVSAKLIGRFATCLADEIEQGDTPREPEPVAVGDGPSAASAAASADAVLGPASGAGASGAAGAGGAGEGGAGGAGEGGAGGAGGAAAGAGPAVSVGEGGAPARPLRPVREAEPIDLLDTAGAPVLKRAAPVAAVLLLLWLVVRARRR